MKILFLFILIFHISHVNADEIYNLIKIPNLEIYKLKNDNNIRYLSAKSNFERMIHHEIFHMIQNTHIEYFDESKFSSFNLTSFNYAECSTCSDRLNLDLYEKTDGFLTEYSKSIPSEDMAEIFSFLMTDKETIEDKINSDKILNNKVNFIKLNLAKIDKNIL